MMVLTITKSVSGGTGTFILELTNIKSMEFHTVCLEPSPSPVESKIKHNITYISKKSLPSFYALTPSNLFLLCKEIVLISALVKKKKPDKVLCVDFHAGLLWRLVKLINWFPQQSIFTFHNNVEMVFKTKSNSVLIPLLKVAGRLIFHDKSDIYIAVSQGVKSGLEKYFYPKHEIKVIYNGTKRIPTRKKSPSRNFIFITISRFSPQKDIATILKAFSTITKKYSRAYLYLVGDGEDKNKILKEINELNISSRIVVYGWQHDVGRLLKKADCFVYSSLWDGYPYAILEAMSYGLPVISSDTPYGPGEILGKNKYGLLFPMQNSKSLAKHMSTIISDRHIRDYYADQSLRRIKNYHAKHMLYHYQNLLAHKGSMVYNNNYASSRDRTTRRSIPTKKTLQGL